MRRPTTAQSAAVLIMGTAILVAILTSTALLEADDQDASLETKGSNGDEVVDCTDCSLEPPADLGENEFTYRCHFAEAQTGGLTHPAYDPVGDYENCVMDNLNGPANEATWTMGPERGEFIVEDWGTTTDKAICLDDNGHAVLQSVRITLPDGGIGKFRKFEHFEQYLTEQLGTAGSVTVEVNEHSFTVDVADANNDPAALTDLVVDEIEARGFTVEESVQYVRIVEKPAKFPGALPVRVTQLAIIYSEDVSMKDNALSIEPENSNDFLWCRIEATIL